MGIGSVFPSVHKHEGWKGQYQRMIRWYEKFKETKPGDFENPDIHEQHDILFACFQNIFMLKDWLHYSAAVPKAQLNAFINSHLELKLCRDICNGTKHFNLSQASVDDDFTIIREYEPFHKARGTERNKIIILADGNKIELKKLAHDCIKLWSLFIEENNLLAV